MIDEGGRRDAEAQIAALLDSARTSDAARAIVERYGGEIFGLLMALVRDEADARDAFSQFCEDLLRALPSFRRASSVRTWAYALARHALTRLRRDPHRRRRRRLETDEVISALVTLGTSQVSRERAHARLDAARAALAPDEQLLLILRIDRELPWADVARVLADGDSSPDEAAVRKRFERIKQRLRTLVAE